jgi:hypothetical protein
MGRWGATGVGPTSVPVPQPCPEASSAQVQVLLVPNVVNSRGTARGRASATSLGKVGGLGATRARYGVPSTRPRTGYLRASGCRPKGRPIATAVCAGVTTMELEGLPKDAAPDVVSEVANGLHRSV